ncbi:LOW QUALITY PROTEIN: uncharacterized protein LRP34_011357 [Phaethornis superciliosus]
MGVSPAPCSPGISPPPCPCPLRVPKGVLCPQAQHRSAPAALAIIIIIIIINNNKQPSIKKPLSQLLRGCPDWEEEEEESRMKQVVVEEELDPEKGCCGSGCCKPGCCCWPCALCCPKCHLPRCSKCPACKNCGNCCGGCGSCLKRAFCFLPRLLCWLPRKLLSCGHLRCLLITLVVVVLLVVIVAGILLMWLRVGQQQAETVLRGGLQRGLAWEEDVATFYLDGGAGDPATVIYDYKNLLVTYRSRLHHSCYVTRVDKDNIPGLDAVTQTFQRRQAEQRLSLPLADPSLLGITSSILCSILPIYWA